MVILFFFFFLVFFLVFFLIFLVFLLILVLIGRIIIRPYRFLYRFIVFIVIFIALFIVNNRLLGFNFHDGFWFDHRLWFHDIHRLIILHRLLGFRFLDGFWFGNLLSFNDRNRHHVFDINRFHSLKLTVQLRDDGALEGEVSLLVEHERAEILVRHRLVILQRSQQFVDPRRDLLVSLRKQALHIATDLVGQREVVLFAIILRENNLIIRRL